MSATVRQYPSIPEESLSATSEFILEGYKEVIDSDEYKKAMAAISPIDDPYGVQRAGVIHSWTRQAMNAAIKVHKLPVEEALTASIAIAVRKMTLDQNISDDSLATWSAAYVDYVLKAVELANERFRAFLKIDAPSRSDGQRIEEIPPLLANTGSIFVPISEAEFRRMPDLREL
ncbi:TPA: hypothetical protein EYP38_01195 [Candidatus Micrarchaeota archaeon]|nr:hypothetical protein [Candidatus Micrarchaeota archaeon]